MSYAELQGLPYYNLQWEYMGQLRLLGRLEMEGSIDPAVQNVRRNDTQHYPYQGIFLCPHLQDIVKARTCMILVQ